LSKATEIFALNRQGFNLRRGVIALGIFVLPLIVLLPLGLREYYLSAAFGAVMVAICDPGGEFAYRASRMALVAVAGTLLTWLAFEVGAGPWGITVAAAFLITLVAGLIIKFGVHRFVSAYLLNIWFIIAIAQPIQLGLEHVQVNPWAQALAWLAGGACWIAVSALAWLLRGRASRPAFIPEIPGDISTSKLTRPKIAYALIRAFAVGIAVAVAFGLHLPNADWMPIATIVAMKPTLDQAELVAWQRLVGAALGAAVAALFLLTLSSKQALEAVIVLLGGLAGSIRTVNYALYTAAVAAVVLIATDLPHPSDLQEEGRRVVFTFIGVGIAMVVTLLASRLAARTASHGTA